MAVPAPELSVVIAVVSGFEPALQCVRSIQREAANLAIEIIVVQSERYDFGPGVATVLAPPNCSEHEMRALGRKAAKGRNVAIVGDRYQVQPGWPQAAQALREGAIAGPVDAPPQLSAAGWAIYLAEYSHLPLDHASVPMGNAVYGGEHSRFRHAPALRVTFAHAPTFTQYATLRFQASREWAAERGATWSSGRRVLAAISRLALPILLLWRRARNTFLQRRHRRRLGPALPFLLVFGVIEAAGEIAGFVLRPDKPACLRRS